MRQRRSRVVRSAGFTIHAVECAMWSDSYSTEEFGRIIRGLMVAAREGRQADVLALPFVGSYIPPRFRRGHIPAWVRTRVLSARRCAFCGSRKKLVVDHVRPVARGGGDELDNLQCLCQTCNLQKHDKYDETTGA